MKESFNKYYKAIGQINSLISKSSSIDEALRGGMKVMHETFALDASILWRKDGKDKQIRPFFWYGPYDFTSVSHKKDEGSVGKCMSSGSPVRELAYKRGDDPETDSDFGSEEIISNIVVPVYSGDELICCAQIVRFVGGEAIDEDTADALEIMAGIISISILENANLAGKYKFNNVLLSTRGIRKAFKSGDSITQVLKGVNIDIYEGEFLAILGESGCGKSTFLNIIGGMDGADEGSFMFMGNEMVKADRKALTAYRRHDIGFVFQSYNLMPNLTAKQNLDMIAELVDDPMDSEEALQMVGLLEKKNSYPGQLSGCQQQRVSIARALVKKPKIILADEPTAALDYETSIEVLEVFEKVVKAGTTLVMVTHNEEITRMADRVLRFKNGQTYEVTINMHPALADELSW